MMKLKNIGNGVWSYDLKSLLPKAEKLSFVQLGNIMLQASGNAACLRGYGTTDPEWVGRYAIQYNDIQPDGTLN